MLSKSAKVFSVALFCLTLLSSAVSAATDPHRFDLLIKTNWYGLYMQGAKIGYVEQSLEKTAAPIDGWRLQTVMTVNMRMGGQQVNMITDDNRLFKSPDGELYTNSLTVTSPTGAVKVNGSAQNGKYVIESNIGGQKTSKSFDYPLDYLDSLLLVEMRISSARTAVGDSFSTTYFEPTPPLTGLIHQTTKITKKEQYLTNGVPSDVYTVSIFIPALNMTTESKIDGYGNTLEGTLGAGLGIKLEGETQAKQLDDTYDILANSLIATDKEIKDPPSLKCLKLKIIGIDTTEIVQTENQRVMADTGGFLNVEISRAATPDRTEVIPMTETSLQPFLAPDPYEQSDAPEVIEMSKEIIGNEKDSWQAAQKINQWIFENIKKRLTPDLSNALQTLHSRRGDCGEHAALAVALLRAAGIPARPVVGLIYWPPGHGFGYHAWVEAYVGKWMMMDPSWGEIIANPAHIALARGDIIEQVKILHRVMGKMKIEVEAEG